MSRITEYEKWKLNGELEDKLLLVEGWARDGLTEKQIADNLGISQDRLIDYKKKYLEFFEAIKKGKEIVDYKVENALLKKALGYNVPVQKAIKLKEVIYDNGKKVKETERIEYANEEIHIPADTTAQIFWLKNRQKEKWRDKQDITNDEELNKLDKILEEQKNAYMDN